MFGQRSLELCAWGPMYEFVSERNFALGVDEIEGEGLFYFVCHWLHTSRRTIVKLKIREVTYHRNRVERE